MQNSVAGKIVLPQQSSVDGLSAVLLLNEVARRQWAD
jgi:hypothetical protein